MRGVGSFCYDAFVKQLEKAALELKKLTNEQQKHPTDKLAAFKKGLECFLQSIKESENQPHKSNDKEIRSPIIKETANNTSAMTWIPTKGKNTGKHGQFLMRL
eukprot:GHVP01035909.1.p1 GENE.GHVP01035909.1~~GHVP01035909.1.p1  ORF type:complete len:103 (+),score=16.27 GHVP01035909.1:61-369(+)